MDEVLLLVLLFIGITLQGSHGIPAVEQPNRGPVRKLESQEKENSEYCLTPECVYAASTILKNMDPRINPCDDFYSFACGNFIANREIPDDKIEITMLDELTDSVQSNLRKILTMKDKNDLKVFQDLKNLYNLCMNESLIEQQGKTPLLKIIKILGGWPVLSGDKWDQRSFNWLDAMVKRRKLGLDFNTFLSIELVGDLKHSSKIIIGIDEASSVISREYLVLGMHERVIRAYLQHMVEVAILLGADIHRATQEMKEVLLFEIKLANITLSTEERRNQTALYNPMTIQELSKMHPTIPWKELINKLLAPIEKLTNDEIINVAVPQFIPKLLKLLHSTPKRVQANYAMWEVVSNTAKFLTKDLRNAELEFASIAGGQTEEEPRWKECISDISEALPLATGALFVRNYFQEDIKKHVVEMVNDIQNAFLNILKKVDWMDEGTKEKALEKAIAMVSHIAYPDELLNDTIIQKYYENLTIHPTNYMEARLNVTLFDLNESLKRFRKPLNKTDWIDHGAAMVINAFYSPSENSIQFPAGFLQGILFDDARPKYMNYGGIGSIIGHEITHGFDDQGRDFDKDGNLVDWWAPSTKSKFLGKAQCIIDQYSKYNVIEIDENINGVNTQGENIADNGGVKEAYLAYNEWVKRNGNEMKLPGLNYTGQQMFWISTANVWCTKSRPGALRLQVLTDPHSPGEFRVNGMLSNRPEFSRDFSCPLDSKMNPKKKCSVW